jgi:hypothetical protein
VAHRIVDHESRLASFGLNLRLKSKPSPFISALRAQIVSGRIDGDEWRAFGAEALHKQAEIRRAMAAPNH